MPIYYNSTKTKGGSILYKTDGFQIQNFPLPPQKNGRPRREGGKKSLTRFDEQDLSDLIPAGQFRAEYGPDFRSSSTINLAPVNKIGTGNRRVEISSSRSDNDDNVKHSISTHLVRAEM